MQVKKKNREKVYSSDSELALQFLKLSQNSFWLRQPVSSICNIAIKRLQWKTMKNFERVFFRAKLRGAFRILSNIYAGVFLQNN